MEKKNKTQSVTYYGKKLYRLNPIIARQKTFDSSKPDYRYEDIEEKDHIQQAYTSCQFIKNE